MLKETLIHANSICTITIIPQTETKHKWFEQTIVTKKRFLFGSYKVTVKAGWGFDEATPDNVCFDSYYGQMYIPERLSLEDMESRQFKLIESKWFAKAHLYITFSNKEYRTYYFESDEEMDEILSAIKLLNPGLVTVTK